MSTTSETELRAEIAWLEARNREVNRQRIEAETLARSQAARLEELERENARLRRFNKHIANQPLSERRRADHESEGHDGEPDFEGAYDAIIEQARAAALEERKA